ncbi:UDP-glucose/GDP-mannose dehydrogenase family, NAD binding domain protein [Paraburkholderia xenovorans LB400]|uniref:3-hydroxyacyl-CoA dehydrogenase n=1 Tax=Paraburkholderia xenovorans (strain LB400) TaxID=266265 RepID=Q13GJ2_PARXL|nr:3-hydroxyacyl-CoA dehydrogenase NAD-binding domain-containing protein [Paraburkholderia xenovorans]ABE36797.1 Putative 3-hydroxyacyl-CoA dehydrogenase [Paraburkholderia xenovorans LB400]AIP33967.1 UDP-glucose/GDP-mannose dehydrogenase family, NAD binding domain protein [Paraburkholderia xenovorans LB400]
MSTATIRRVAVVGTGVIGASWAACFLSRGLQVAATDPSSGARQRLEHAVMQHWPTLVTAGLASGASLGNLTFHDSLDAALEGAQFVQENGPERIDAKRELFAAIDAATASDVVIASSSSGLLISDVQTACRHPERVVLGHPFNPPHLIPLVEVIGGRLTSETAIRAAIDFYRAIGKRPINPQKEISGHIANRLQAALWREAFHLVSIGAATVQDIDDAIAYGPGLRWAVMGPFANLHLSGGAEGMRHLLEHLGAPIENWWAQLGTPAMTPDLKRMVIDGVDAALAGRKDSDLAAQRDLIILDVLRAKAAASAIP